MARITPKVSGQRRTSRGLALFLAFGLCLSTPTSSRAVLTELFVGGMVLLEVAGIVGEAIPQIKALAGSVAAVVKSGHEIGNTVKGILDKIFPGSGGRKPKAGAKGRTGSGRPPADPPPGTDETGDDAGTTPGTGSEDTGGPLGDLPEIVAPRKPGGTSAGGVLARPEAGEGARQVEALVLAWKRRETVVQALVLAEGPGRTVLEAGLAEASKEYEARVERIALALTEAARVGTPALIEGFEKAAEALPEAERAAVAPVIEAVAGRGAGFRSLHGKADGPAAPGTGSVVHPRLRRLARLAEGWRSGTGRSRTASP